MQAGFVKLRRGIIEHLEDGRLTLDEYTVFVTILLRADFRNATWVGSANEIARTCGIRKQRALHYLASLRAKGYVQFEYPKGAHVKYPIFVPKYSVSSVPTGTEETESVSNGNRGKWSNCETGTEDFNQRQCIQCDARPEEVNLKKKREEEKPAQKSRGFFPDSYRPKNGKQLEGIVEIVTQGPPRKDYLEFVALRDAGKIPKGMNWEKWQKLTPEERQKLQVA